MTPAAELGGLSLDELGAFLGTLGQRSYRAKQIREAAWSGRAGRFSEITVLPLELRDQLQAELGFLSLETVADVAADRGLTHKLLLRARDGQEVEAVVIRHPGGGGRRARNTVCVSSQVGCSIGCIFCATGLLGLRRNLSAAEIVDQVRVATAVSSERGLGATTNVVFMGMGEPLQNLDAVIASIRLLQEWGVSPRRVVVSTSGLVPAIDRLATTGLPVRLAISLHAAQDELRNQLVPLNRRYPLEELLSAAQRFAAVNGRRISFEYVLIQGVNDRASDALALRRMANAVRAHVNVIPMNSIPGSPLRSPPPAACREFALLVGARATIRFSRGDRATAACGQLRASMDPLARRASRSEQVADALLAPAATLGRESTPEARQPTEGARPTGRT